MHRGENARNIFTSFDLHLCVPSFVCGPISPAAAMSHQVPSAMPSRPMQQPPSLFAQPGPGPGMQQAPPYPPSSLPSQPPPPPGPRPGGSTSSMTMGIVGATPMGSMPQQQQQQGTMPPQQQQVRERAVRSLVHISISPCVCCVSLCCVCAAGAPVSAQYDRVLQ